MFPTAAAPYRSTMVTLQIEHAITDYGTWRAAFDRFARAREDGGVQSERIGSPTDDPHFLVIELDFASVEQAAAFRDFLHSKVWVSPANAPALAGAPRTRILVPVES
jgi:hypothetical protein